MYYYFVRFRIARFDDWGREIGHETDNKIYGIDQPITDSSMMQTVKENIGFSHDCSSADVELLNISLTHAE